VCSDRLAALNRSAPADGLQIVRDLTWNLRRVKDADELQVIHQAACMVEAGMAAARDALRPGVREIDVAAAHAQVLEMLRAQAIVARTYAAHHRLLSAGKPFHILASTAHQQYAGRVPSTSPAWTAVRGAIGINYFAIRIPARLTGTGAGHRVLCEGIGAHNRQNRAARATSAAATTSVPHTVAYVPRGSPSAAASTVTRCAVPVTSTSSSVSTVRRCVVSRRCLLRLPITAPVGLGAGQPGCVRAARGPGATG